MKKGCEWHYFFYCELIWKFSKEFRRKKNFKLLAKRWIGYNENVDCCFVILWMFIVETFKNVGNSNDYFYRLTSRFALSLHFDIHNWFESFDMVFNLVFSRIEYIQWECLYNVLDISIYDFENSITPFFYRVLHFYRKRVTIIWYLVWNQSFVGISFQAKVCIWWIFLSYDMFIQNRFQEDKNYDGW